MKPKSTGNALASALKARLRPREKLTSADHHLHQDVCDLPPEVEAVTHHSEAEQCAEAVETLHLESATL